MPPASPRPLGGTLRPGLVHARCVRLQSRAEVCRRVHGRPRATFVLSHQDPNSVTRWCPEPRASRPGHFRPLNPSTTRFSFPRPPISVSSRIEEWAEGGGVARLNHSYFCFSRWCGAGPGAPGEAGARRGPGGGRAGAGAFTCPPRGRRPLAARLTGGGPWAGRWGRARPAPLPPAPAPRPRHVERTSHAYTVTQEVKETGTHGPTSHRNKGGVRAGRRGSDWGGNGPAGGGGG